VASAFSLSRLEKRGNVGCVHVGYDVLVPVITTLKLKVVKLPVFDATVSVSVACVEAPAFRTVFSLFHCSVR